jgi:hypothetical protein
MPLLCAIQLVSLMPLSLSSSSGSSYLVVIAISLFMYNVIIKNYKNILDHLKFPLLMC